MELLVRRSACVVMRAEQDDCACYTMQQGLQGFPEAQCEPSTRCIKQTAHYSLILFGIEQTCFASDPWLDASLAQRLAQPLAEVQASVPAAVAHEQRQPLSHLRVFRPVQ